MGCLTLRLVTARGPGLSLAEVFPQRDRAECTSCNQEDTDLLRCERCWGGICVACWAPLDLEFVTHLKALETAGVSDKGRLAVLCPRCRA